VHEPTFFSRHVLVNALLIVMGVSSGVVTSDTKDARLQTGVALTSGVTVTVGLAGGCGVAVDSTWPTLAVTVCAASVNTFASTVGSEDGMLQAKEINNKAVIIKKGRVLGFISFSLAHTIANLAVEIK
jgi:hypothetical protein